MDTLDSSDFRFNEKRRLHNSDFNKTIPDLCLADIFLIEIKYRSGVKLPFIKIMNAFECVYECSSCQTSLIEVEGLLIHLKDEDHLKKTIRSKNSRTKFLHPLLAYENEFQMGQDGRFDICQEASICQADISMGKTPKAQFLRAHAAAGAVERKAKEQGVEFKKSKLEYSAKEIVENAKRSEINEAIKILKKEAMLELQSKVKHYNVLLEKMDSRAQHIVNHRFSKQNLSEIKAVINKEYLYSEQIRLKNLKKIIDVMGKGSVKLKECFSKLTIPQDISESSVSDTGKQNIVTPVKRSSELTNALLNQNQQADDQHSKIYPDILPVLRLLVAFEEYLGCLGPKITDLLTQTLKVIANPKDNEIKEIYSTVLTLDNCILLETVTEKLKGILITNEIENKKVHAIYKTIERTSNLLELAFGYYDIKGNKHDQSKKDVSSGSKKRKRRGNRPPLNDNSKVPKTDSSSASQNKTKVIPSLFDVIVPRPGSDLDVLQNAIDKANLNALMDASSQNNQAATPILNKSSSIPSLFDIAVSPPTLEASWGNAYNAIKSKDSTKYINDDIIINSNSMLADSIAHDLKNWNVGYNAMKIMNQHNLTQFGTTNISGHNDYNLNSSSNVVSSRDIAMWDRRNYTVESSINNDDFNRDHEIDKRISIMADDKNKYSLGNNSYNVTKPITHDDLSQSGMREDKSYTSMSETNKGALREKRYDHIIDRYLEKYSKLLDNKNNHGPTNTSSKISDVFNKKSNVLNDDAMRFQNPINCSSSVRKKSNESTLDDCLMRAYFGNTINDINPKVDQRLNKPSNFEPIPFSRRDPKAASFSSYSWNSVNQSIFKR